MQNRVMSSVKTITKNYWPCFLILLAFIGFVSKSLYNYPVGLMALIGAYTLFRSPRIILKDKILKTFVKYLDSYYKRVVAGELESLIKDCLSHAARLGEVITVRLPDATIKGVFNGIDKDGNLLLATDEGERPISAGDVFL